MERVCVTLNCGTAVREEGRCEACVGLASGILGHGKRKREEEEEEELEYPPEDEVCYIFCEV